MDILPDMNKNLNPEIIKRWITHSNKVELRIPPKSNYAFNQSRITHSAKVELRIPKKLNYAFHKSRITHFTKVELRILQKSNYAFYFNLKTLTIEAITHFRRQNLDPKINAKNTEIRV